MRTPSYYIFNCPAILFIVNKNFYQGFYPEYTNYKSISLIVDTLFQYFSTCWVISNMNFYYLRPGFLARRFLSPYTYWKWFQRVRWGDCGYFYRHFKRSIRKGEEVVVPRHYRAYVRVDYFNIQGNRYALWLDCLNREIQVFKNKDWCPLDDEGLKILCSRLRLCGLDDCHSKLIFTPVDECNIDY